ncbi:MAG: patatin-like phospholipase family protein, partial [Phaeodactylibacter sp.]|nr:patatin-like phospholipase family protein [Phaeodactylibacter sp.]
RGAAHVGMLQFMQELEIPVHLIVGTSAGAIVGSLLAADNPPDTILEVFRKIRLFDYSRFTWAKPGLLDADSFEDLLRPYFKEDDFSTLHKNLRIVSANLLEGEIRVINEGPIIRPVLASAAYPGLFSPIRLQDGLYVDGGIFNNFPADLIREECDVLIGMNVNPISEVHEKELHGTWQVMMRVMELTFQQKDAAKGRLCDLYLEPKSILPYSIFDTLAVDDVVEIGYEEAKKHREAFLKLMD